MVSIIQSIMPQENHSYRSNLLENNSLVLSRMECQYGSSQRH